MSSVDVKLNSAIGPVAPQLERENLRSIDQGGPKFKETLQSQLDNLADKKPVQAPVLPAILKFSNHAVERMSQRGISFTPEQMVKIEGAARKAAEKGAKETLIFTGDSALIVSVKNNTIVTVMDKAAMKENVFTNIDSTVVV